MKRTRSLLALLMMLALILTGCGGDDGDGGTGAGDTDDGEGEEATGDPIIVGVISDLSGATADVGTPYSEGIRGYVDWINESGGVSGRPLEAMWEDYQYDVAIAERLYSDFIAQGAVVIQGWGTGDTEALRSRVNADEVPFMSASYSAGLVDPSETPYNFVPGTSYSDQMAIALQWISEQDPEAEVAVFHHDSPFGTSPVADGGDYIEEQGYDLGYESYVMPGGATDFVGELRRVEQQGASYIIIQNVESPAAVLASDVAAQGLDIQIILLNWAAGETFIELAGDAAEGAIGVQPWAPAAHETDGQEDARAYLEEQGESLEDKGLHYTQGWWTMALMAEGIAAVVESGEEVTGPAIKDALEQIQDFDTGDVSLPISFSEESHAGMEGSPLWQVEDGVWTLLEESRTP